MRAKVEEAFGVSSNELRRDGRAPLVFVGRKLAEATSYSAGTSLWYEIAAYGGDKGYAAAIKVFKKRDAEPDRFLAKRFPSLEGVVRYLEEYDAALDVSVPDDVMDERTPPAMAAIRAVALRQRIAEAEAEYAAAAGEVLNELMQPFQSPRDPLAAGARASAHK